MNHLLRPDLFIHPPLWGFAQPGVRCPFSLFEGRVEPLFEAPSHLPAPQDPHLLPLTARAVRTACLSSLAPGLVPTTRSGACCWAPRLVAAPRTSWSSEQASTHAQRPSSLWILKVWETFSCAVFQISPFHLVGGEKFVLGHLKSTTYSRGKWEKKSTQFFLWRAKHRHHIISLNLPACHTTSFIIPLWMGNLAQRFRVVSPRPPG